MDCREFLFQQALAQNTGPGAPVSGGAKCGGLLSGLDHITHRLLSSQGFIPSWAIQPGLAIKLGPCVLMTPVGKD